MSNTLNAPCSAARASCLAHVAMRCEAIAAIALVSYSVLYSVFRAPAALALGFIAAPPPRRAAAPPCRPAAAPVPGAGLLRPLATALRAPR